MAVLGLALVLHVPVVAQSLSYTGPSSHEHDATPTLQQKVIADLTVLRERSAHYAPQERQTGSIAGRVTDADTGGALPGVNVFLVGTTQGAATDSEGAYRIDGLEAGTYDVQASYIGFQTQIVEDVVVRADEVTSLNFELTVATSEFDEVVVVGYGTQRKSDLTGSVTSLRGEDVEHFPVTSLDQAIQGQAPGVYVKQTSHQPGGGISIRIRGTNSINSGGEPLYVIDGFPIYPDNSAVNAGGSHPPTNVLASLSLTDVESIEILKDASATAIYGSRAANGVVLITTKRGENSKTRVGYQGSYSAQNLANAVNTLDAQGYARYMNQIEVSQGGSPMFTDQEIQAMGAGTDWLDEVLRTGSIQDHQLSIYGGNEDTRYAFMTNYHSNEGILLDTDFTRYGLRLNLDNKALDGFIDVSNSWSVNRSISNNAPTGFGGPGGMLITALGLDPTVPVRTDGGDYDFALYDGRFWINPVAELRESVDRNQDNRLFGNTMVTLNLTDALKFKTSFGADVVSNEHTGYFGLDTRVGRDQNMQLDRSTRNITNILNENIFSYTKQLNDAHFVDAVVGYTWQKEKNEIYGATTRDLPADNFAGLNLNNGINPQIPWSGRAEWELESFLSRVNYNYRSRYLATLTMRRDGSSKFGADNKYAFFPSAAVGWRIVEEPFFRNSILGRYVSNLKVRASYGITGNSEIPVYRSLSGFSARNYVFGGGLAGGLVENRISNPDLRWESTQMRNIGLDLGFFNGRLDFVIDVFSNKTDDLLMNVSIPSSMGFNSIMMNSGSLENKGIEVGADYLALSRPNFSWSLNGNISVVRNELTDLGLSRPFFGGGGSGHLGVAGSWVEEGYPLGVWRGFDYIGIFQSEEEIASSASRPTDKPGYPRYRDVNGDGRITADDDYVIIGDPNPDFTWGLGSSVAYRNFDFRVFLYGVHGIDVRNLQASEMGDGIQKINQIANILDDSWRPDNPNASRPVIDGNRDFANSYRDSDYFVEDGSFIRLQNVSVGYTLPMNVSKYVERARVYVSAQNLFVLTDYSGFDPEVSRGGQSNTNLGDDYDSYPRARTITFGLDLGF